MRNQKPESIDEYKNLSKNEHGIDVTERTKMQYKRKKPETIDEYKKWLKKEHGIEITERTKTQYDSVAIKIKKSLEESLLWTSLVNSFSEYNDEYELDTKYKLGIITSEVELYTKPFESFFLKTFRKNVLDNINWDDEANNEPNGGWILPDNWYANVNDIVRTLIVVKYLDGVEFLSDKIKNHCEQHNTPCSVSFEAKDEGYYAAHLCMIQKCEIPNVNWDTTMVDVPIEIQITTRLQEVIRKLTHVYYEERRVNLKVDDIKWQWDYKSEEFIPNYLGHILHYVEGMIMEIIERQKVERK